MAGDRPDRDRLETAAAAAGRRGASRPGAGENSGLLPDLLRRGLTLGFTGLFMTEEALRRALGDTVPRDMIEFLLDQSERMRAEFLDRISREFGRVLDRMDPVEIARRLLEGRTVEVTAQIRLVPEKSKRRERAGGSRKDAQGDSRRKRAGDHEEGS